MATAGKRIARLKRIDRAAVFIITLGGVGVVVGVLGMLVFIAAEAVPMFRSATLTPHENVRVTGEPPTAVPALPVSVGPPAPHLEAVGVDEYRRYLYGIAADAQIVFHQVEDGAHAMTLPMPGLPPGTTVVASSRSSIGNYLAAATADGRVALAQPIFTPKYENEALSGLDVKIRERGVAKLDDTNRPIRQVSYYEDAGRKYVAAIVGDAELSLWRTDDAGAEHRAKASAPAGERLLHVRVGRNDAVIAASESGHLYHWVYNEDEPVLTDVSSVAAEPITALEFLLGGTSIVVGTASGQVTGWFRGTIGDGREAMFRAHTYEPQGATVIAFAPSPRDRSFAAAGADGSIVLRHQTSERTLARMHGTSPARRLVIAPKADSIFAVGEGTFAGIDLKNPHPEISWRALFGKVWYEGYAQPEYVWQSTGGTDDFEPKLSLMPLIFGTIKGTFYAMIFAIPIAVLSALYTSQFVHPSIKAKVKPAVEIMAALPSVVIGFLAGLYLASAVEKNLVGVFVMLILMPIFGTSGVLIWRLLPRRVSAALRPGTEVFLIVPLLLLAGWTALQLGPSVEAWLFAADARGWLQSAMGLTYDQRNCLVVGLAMGFAVIPIIFTISEDAFTSVPSNLTAASLALGASRWQTAVRVVLPTASPGVFSAVMIGFGRAVGETMIVLMATGNTPVMDWSIFNGIRTLSANIAVEIPEAAQGSTLYRTLFLAASLLFVMTFLINTVAELIRQRLRERYKAV
jgi:phosphate transport system permease protein